jgi:hypothetical protein
MALWHIGFELLPKQLIGDVDEVPEAEFRA